MEQERYQTPCYIVNGDDFENNIKMFQECLTKYFEKNWIMGYSFKTNYLPFILKVARGTGCYAEVVSAKEYLLAKELGYTKNEIIFNGPAKTKEHFIDAMKNNCVVNIDSKQELEWLKSLPKNMEYRVGIRVNFQLEKILPGQTLMGNEGGRFGFCDENGELKAAIAEIKKCDHVEIAYLHMHMSTKSKSAAIYRELIKKACQIIEREDLPIKYINVGGSFFGGGDDGTAYENYLKVIKEELKNNNQENMGIMVEPGASVIATSISYMTRVIDIKNTVTNKYIVTDGSRLHIDPFFTKSTYKYDLLTTNAKMDETQTVVGSTCMEKDIITKLQGENELDIGDKIIFYTVGSYTMCMNSDFIFSEPRVYAEYQGKQYLVRNEKDINTYMDRDILEEVL